MKQEFKIKVRLTADDYSARLQKITNNRDYLLFTILWELGVRISEALNIRIEHIDFNSNTVNIYSLKKKDTAIRVLPLSRETIRLIRMKIGNNKGGLVFDIGRKQAYNLSKEYFGCNPHAIRHSRAIDLITHGTSIEVVRRLLGHTWLSTTQIYLDFDFETMRRELDKVQLIVQNKESKL